MVNLPTFQKREFPLPIVVADTRPQGFALLPPGTLLPLNSTQYEFTPWEMGSYDPALSSFVDIRFLGTHLTNGKPTNSSACVTGFDQTSFVFGTSSSLFNVCICIFIPFIYDSELFLQKVLYEISGKIDEFDKDSSNALLNILRQMLLAVSTRAEDVGNYPNVCSYLYLD